MDAMRARNITAKTVREFERYGIRRIVTYFLQNGRTAYSKEVAWEFVLQERKAMEVGYLPHYQWAETRRAAVYLEQMAEYGQIQEKPMRKWEAEHNPLLQSALPEDDLSHVEAVIRRCRDSVSKLDLSEKSKTNYIYCGFGAILEFFQSRGERYFSQELLDAFVNNAKENFLNGSVGRSAHQNIRKAAYWLTEYMATGQVSQGRLANTKFVYAAPEFEELILEYRSYMDAEAYLKEGTRSLYISSARRFLRCAEELGLCSYKDITLPDVTRCLSKISETEPLGIFCLTGKMLFLDS